MPKEIPATTLILDSIVDVTRKKQPCRGSQASTWIQSFAPQGHRAVPPHSSRGRCSCAGSRGVLADPTPPARPQQSHFQCPSPDASSRAALPLGCSQPEPGDSAEEPLHHPTIPEDEVTRPQHRVRTLHPREMSALLKQTLLGSCFLTHLFLKSHIPKGPRLGRAGP